VMSITIDIFQSILLFFSRYRSGWSALGTLFSNRQSWSCCGHCVESRQSRNFFRSRVVCSQRRFCREAPGKQSPQPGRY
jgi:hypothetical protein